MENYDIKIIKDELIDEAAELIFDTTIAQKVSSTYVKDPIKGKKLFKEMFKESFFSEEFLMYGLFVNEELLGVIGVEENYYISMFYTKNGHQHQGIGKILMGKVIEDCINKGIDELEVCAFVNSIEAYRNMGFEYRESVSDILSKEYIPMVLHINETKLKK